MKLYWLCLRVVSCWVVCWAALLICLIIFCSMAAAATAQCPTQQINSNDFAPVKDSSWNRSMNLFYYFVSSLLLLESFIDTSCLIWIENSKTQNETCCTFRLNSIASQTFLLPSYWKHFKFQVLFSKTLAVKRCWSWVYFNQIV